MAGGTHFASTDEMPVIIVSGLPRSGTSMLMRMLDAGGVTLVVDGVRSSDEDNPVGYFELEAVKQIARDSSWVAQARGKAVKVVSPLLKHLPPRFSYKVIFVERDLHEVMASQRQMLARRGVASDDATDEQLTHGFRRHLDQVRTWLAAQRNVAVLYVSYRAIICDPRTPAANICRFLGASLDADRMAAAVDPTLYRQRR